MNHNKSSSSKRNNHSTFSAVSLLLLLLLSFKEEKITIRNMSTSSRFFATAWTSGYSNYKTSSFYRRKCHRILNNFNNGCDNRYMSYEFMPRTVLNAINEGSSSSTTISSNSKNVLMTNKTEIKSNNNFLLSFPNFFVKMFNQRFEKNKDAVRSYSSSSAYSDEYATSSSLSNGKEEESVEKSESTLTNNNNNKTFFLNVDKKVKDVQSSNISLDPRTIFFPNGTNSLDDLVINNNENENQNEAESELSSESFPKEMYDEFKEAVEQLLEINRGIKREDPKDIDIVLSWILNPSRTTNIHLTTLQSSDTTTEEEFRKDLKQQHTLFLENHNFTLAHYQLATRILCVLGDYCAKRMLLPPIIIGWEKVKESGMILREPAMNTYLYIVGNSMPSSIQNLTSIEEDDDDDVLSSSDKSCGDDITGEVALFHDLLYKPTENSITLRIKTFISKKQIQDAESLLASYAKDNLEQLRLRTYFPVLKAYCEIDDCTSAFRIFYKMRNSPGVKLEPENYVLLLSTLAENGVFTDDSNPIPEAIELGYSASYGTVLFNELLTDMSTDVLEIDSSSARRLYNAFLSTFPTNEQTTNAMKELPSLADLPIETTLCTNDELVVSRVSINSTTAICPRTRAKLRLIILDMDDKRNFYEKLLTMSQEQYFAFTGNFPGKVKKSDDVEATKKLMQFADWLDNREGEPFTAIIDGANAAYFGQNFDAGRFNYHQIMFLVHTLEKMNENPLVVIPFKYTMPNFASNSGVDTKRQILSFKEKQVLNELNETGKLYTVPSRCLDDYYWMLASVSNQTTSRSGRDLWVPINNDQNRWPGTRPMLLSNDQMRDHRLEVMEPRLFRRWTTSHIVNYNFTAFCADEDQYDEKNITLSAIDFFSREIQGNPTYAENGEENGSAWHLPVKDWNPHERLCIRIPKKK